MNFAFIKSNECINVVVLDSNPTDEEKSFIVPNICDEIVECDEGFWIGDYYVNGKWSKDNFMTPEQKRANAYSTMVYKEDSEPLIMWEENAITVDQANKLFYDYFAEGSLKADELQIIISDAKTYIRELFPD